jgi:hypothetical protein
MHATQDDDVESETGHFWPPITISLVFGALLLLRLTEPSDLYDNDQPEQVGAITYLTAPNVEAEGKWFVQRTEGTKKDRRRIAGKPPLYTWIGGPATAWRGRSSGSH